MTCKCGSGRIMNVHGKVSDCVAFTVPHLMWEKDGFVFSELGLGSGDYLNFSVCMDCGTVQGWTPIEDEVLEDL